MDIWLLVVTLQNLDIDVESRLDVTLQSLDLDLESRLDVMLHRFLFSQAESPKGSKTQANSSPLKCKMSICSPTKKVGNLYSKYSD